MINYNAVIIPASLPELNMLFITERNKKVIELYSREQPEGIMGNKLPGIRTECFSYFYILVVFFWYLFF